MIALAIVSAIYLNRKEKEPLSKDSFLKEYDFVIGKYKNQSFLNNIMNQNSDVLDSSAY